MENQNSSLLPNILEALNCKPGMSDTYENLVKKIKDPNALEDALDLGINLGILTMTDDLVSTPLNYGDKGRVKSKKKNLNKDEAAPEELGEYFGVQPRRTYSVLPEILTMARRRRGSRRRSRSRRRRGSRRRRSRSRRR